MLLGLRTAIYPVTDLEAAKAARQEIAEGMPPIPWDQVKADLGLV